jgi:RNA polymerase sigma factor (sigma-70 family)
MSELYHQEINELYLRHEPQVYRIARRGLSHQDAEEIVNSAFEAAYRHWVKVRIFEYPIGYVIRAALNMRIDRLRAQGQAALPLDDLDDLDEAGSSEAPESDHIDLRTALTYLSPREEQLIILRYWTGLTSIEIARVLDLAPGHVGRTLSDARKKLAKMLAAQNQTDSDGDPDE